MKITIKTAMSNISSHGCITEFLKKIANSTTAHLFSFWKQALQNSCQKGYNSTILPSFCLQILYVLIEITCITRKIPCLKEDKLKGLHLQKKKKKKKAPWYKGKKIGLVVYTGHVSQGDYHAQGPLPGERALMLETRADTWLMQGSFTGWPVNHAVASAPQRNGSQT